MLQQRVLVTGGAGFIGAHVVKSLLKRGYAVSVVDNLSTGHLSHVDTRARFYQTDLCSPDLIDVMRHEQPDIVAHFAAQASVEASFVNPQKDSQINIQGSMNLFQLSAEIGVQRVIYASSGGAVYGEPNYLPCDEAHPISPLSPYGASKFAAELYLQLYHQTGYTILRYANVYGPNQNPFGEAGVIAKLAYQMLNGKQCTIYGSGEQKRDFLHIQDAVSSVICAIQQNATGIYNIGTGFGTTINQVFIDLARLTGYTLPPAYEAARGGEVFEISLDSTKAHKELDWKFAISLYEGLQDMIRSHSNQNF